MKYKKLFIFIVLIVLVIFSIFSIKIYSYKKSSKYEVSNFIQQMSKPNKSSQDKKYWSAKKTYIALDYCENVSFENLEEYILCKKFIIEDYSLVYSYIFKYEDGTQEFIFIKWDNEENRITELYLDELREKSIN